MKTTDAYKWVDLRLREAVETIKELPLSRHDMPDKAKSGWPDYARAAGDAYGYDDPEHPLIPKDTDKQKRKREDSRNRRVLAMQRERIKRMNEALDWTTEWLTIDERKIVLARAEGVSWDDLKDHRSIRTLQRIRDRALGAILIRLYG